MRNTMSEQQHSTLLRRLFHVPIRRVRLLLRPRHAQIKRDDPPLKLKEWDIGLFASELVQQSLVPREISSIIDGHPKRLTTPSDVPAPLSTGTFSGSHKAATEIFHHIEQRYGYLRNIDFTLLALSRFVGSRSIVFGLANA